MKKSTRGRLAAALASVALAAIPIMAPTVAYAADSAQLFVACQPGDPGVAAIVTIEASAPTEVGFLIDDVSQGTAQVVNPGDAMPIQLRTSVPDGSHNVSFWSGSAANVIGGPLPVTFPQLCGSENSGGDPSGSIASFGATGSEDPRSISLAGEAALENIDGDSVTVTFTISGPTTLTAPNATVNPDGSFSSSVTGQTIPDGTYQVTAQILINGSPSGAPSTTSVTFTTPVDPDPVAATVSGTFTGVLVDNSSVVQYTIAVTPNDDEGPFTVIIEDGHGTVIQTVSVTDGTPQSGSFFYECGAEHFVAYLEGDTPTDDAFQLINIPCHVPDNPGGGDNSGGGDGNGGNNGGGGDNSGGNGGTGGSTAGGGDTTGGTGGSGTGTNGTNGTGDTEAPPGAETGDVWTAGNSNQAGSANYSLILAGVVLLLVVAIARVTREMDIVAATVLRAKGLLVR